VPSFSKYTKITFLFFFKINKKNLYELPGSSGGTGGENIRSGDESIVAPIKGFYKYNFLM
jgi:hypothetical protein